MEKKMQEHDNVKQIKAIMYGLERVGSLKSGADIQSRIVYKL